MKRGTKMSEEAKQKMREHRRTEEHKRHLSEAAKGKSWEEKFGSETAERVRNLLHEKMAGENNPNYGKHPSEETRKKMSEAQKGKVGEKNSFYGHCHTEETKQRYRNRVAGKTYEEIYGEEGAKKLKEVMSQSLKGLLAGEKNPNYGKRGSEASHYGYKHSEEVKIKIREARLQQDPAPHQYNTAPEIKIQQLFQESSISFEKQKKITGHPDFFIAPNVCIFVDGDYWHANPKYYEPNWIHPQMKKEAQQLWEKDFKVTQKLESQGYVVLRFWESEINDAAYECLKRTKEVST